MCSFYKWVAGQSYLEFGGYFLTNIIYKVCWSVDQLEKYKILIECGHDNITLAFGSCLSLDRQTEENTTVPSVLSQDIATLNIATVLPCSI